MFFFLFHRQRTLPMIGGLKMSDGARDREK